MSDDDGGPLRSSRTRRSRGVTIVEFALILPLFFLLVFGIVEFGWAYAQQLDVRHGAREGARLAAVNAFEDTDDLRDEVCRRMDAGANVSVAFGYDASGIGQTATVTVGKPLDQLTGFLDFALGDITLRSSVQTRLELPAGWTADFSPSTGPVDLGSGGFACNAP